MYTLVTGISNLTDDLTSIPRCIGNWSGDDCSQFICATANPCLNGGVCAEYPDDSSRYLCACPLGFTGENCQYTTITREGCKCVCVGVVCFSLPVLSCFRCSLLSLSFLAHGHTHTHTHSHSRARTHTHARTHAHTHKHIYSLTLTRAHTHTRTQPLYLLPSL